MTLQSLALHLAALHQAALHDCRAHPGDKARSALAEALATATDSLEKVLAAAERVGPVS